MVFCDCAGGALSLLGKVQFELQKLIDSYVSICCHQSLVFPYELENVILTS